LTLRILSGLTPLDLRKLEEILIYNVHNLIPSAKPKFYFQVGT